MDPTMRIPTGGIDYKQTEPVKCEKCEGELFHPAFMLRRVSALVSPNGQEAMVPVQLFACLSCNHVNEDMYPIE
jgi:hypothetical protein